MNFLSWCQHTRPRASLQGPTAVRHLASGAALGALLTFAGCASPVPENAEMPIVNQWHAPLAHGGALSNLHQWWSQFEDPLLLRLIEAAQQASPTLARAAANIAHARAERVASGATLLPALDLSATATRGRASAGVPASTATSASLHAGWELDLFGANRAGADAAQARLESSTAGWHDARVSLAAEVARYYVELRACEAMVQQTELDTTSRAQTARLTDLTARAGMRAPAMADLARASAAQGQVIWVQQQAHCDLLIKVLVALAAQDESLLRRELAAKAAQLPAPAGLRVGTVPAQVLAQRPDIHAAARDVAAASAAATQANARRWPRITLAGSIGTTRLSSVGGIGASADGMVWSIGPVSITFPLFDGGTSRAQAQAAQVHYRAATTVYAARLRAAIQEVESALVSLQSTAQRSDDARIASDGFERSYRATAASYHAGVASLFELEDARRSLVSAQSALIELRRERLMAWIALYRALGGGWSPPTPANSRTPL